MSTARILILQPDSMNPAGRLGDWLVEAGAELEVRALPEDAVPARLDEHDGLVCLGGTMRAEDDTAHPWLADLRALLAHAAHTRVPTLGIGLGAQVLATVTGGRVVRGTEGPEAGAGLVSKKDPAWADPLFADLPLMQDVFQFHRDVVEALPHHGQVLASTPRYPHQAFRVGRCAYGIQFHIESTPAIARGWVATAPDIAEYARPHALEDASLETAHADIAETWQPFAHRFVRLAAGELEAARDDQRGLPLA